MPLQRSLNWSSAVRDMRNDRVQLPAGFIGARSLVESSARNRGVKLWSSTGAYDRSVIMQLAVAAAKAQQARTGEPWHTAMSVALKAAWSAAQYVRCRASYSNPPPIRVTIPLSLRKGVMARAWAMFRQNYNYPRVPFRSIGRHCLVSCIKAAWSEAREIARLAGLGVAALRQNIASVSKPAERIGITTRFSEDSGVMVRRLRSLQLYNAALEFAGGAA